tara:strand:+ start:86 stop:505 length:420 start_codon:yes stop_codon:yes gene_type:complete
MNKEVISELQVDTLIQKILPNLNNKLLIIKFGADWCGPCKRIKSVFNEQVIKSEENILVADLDVDENFEIYGKFKTAKLVNGIPAILAFKSQEGGERLNELVIDSVTGGDTNKIIEFFQRVNNRASSIKNTLIVAPQKK